MAISNIRFAGKPASTLDPVEDMRTAVGPGYLLFAVRRWDTGPGTAPAGPLGTIAKSLDDQKISQEPACAAVRSEPF
jgi:hypothetical protein